MTTAIIGAGVAGLRVARRLDDAGVAVQLFDKARGAGGRLSTRRTEDGPFDHGAQYFTAREKRFRSVVDAWLETGVVARWEPRCVRVDAKGGRVEAKPAARFVGLPGMSGVARALRGALPIELGVRIQFVRPGEDGFEFESDEGHLFGPFERVVVAVPAPQAAPLLAFAPSLAARAHKAQLLPCHAVLACFAALVPVAFDAAFVEGASLGWAARNASKPGRPDDECWVLHSTATWSEAHVDARPDEVESALLSAFQEICGVPLPDLRSVSMHRWLYARASGSAPGVQWNPELGVGLCGDWLVGDRVEDAFVSGDRLADAILGEGEVEGVGA